jgi:putative endonuclease
VALAFNAKGAHMAEFYVYIMTNRERVLYIGVTNNLRRRVYEHQHKRLPGYASRHNLTQLAYFEATPNVQAAIAREKQIKGWRRVKKMSLIESLNPDWNDLSAGWSDPPGEPRPR